MTRIEKLTSLKEMEQTKLELEALLDDVSDYYTKEISFTVQLNSTAYEYRKKYDGSPIDVNKTRFIGYLKQEIDGLEYKINELIGDLI
jgi:hypothetical protein